MSHDSHFSHSSYPSQLCHLPCAICHPVHRLSAIAYWLSRITFHVSPLTLSFPMPPKPKSPPKPAKGKTVATLRHDAKRNTKVELNHRSQACEGPGRHRYSRCVKWSERRVPPPSAPAPEAGASLLGYALERLPSALNLITGHYFNRAGSLPADRGQLRKKGLAKPKPGRKLVEHQGSAPCILVCKTSV